MGRDGQCELILEMLCRKKQQVLDTVGISSLKERTELQVKIESMGLSDREESGDVHQDKEREEVGWVCIARSRVQLITRHQKETSERQSEILVLIEGDRFQVKCKLVSHPHKERCVCRKDNPEIGCRRRREGIE